MAKEALQEGVSAFQLERASDFGFLLKTVIWCIVYLLSIQMILYRANE